MSLLLSSSFRLYSPPPYTNTNNSNTEEITQVVPATTNTNTSNSEEEANKNSRTSRNKQQHRHHHRHHHHRICHICGNRNPPSDTREIGPFLIHRTEPDLVLICPCLNKAHPICLKNYGTDYICNVCNYIYQSRRYIIFFAQFLCFVCHLLSFASAVGLVFGLSQLGRALDEIGLGSEIGPKLDGDETWQDHEMAQIVAWLNIVHFATGFAGEALLGLVYIVGVCLMIGLDRTLIMVSNILYIQLDPMLLKWKKLKIPRWIRITCICISLLILGLVLGTYLLFFSWIWASALHHFRKRVLYVKVEKHFHHHYENNKLSPSTLPQSTLPLTQV
jgi:hypothetical protein